MTLAQDPVERHGEISQPTLFDSDSAASPYQDIASLAPETPVISSPEASFDHSTPTPHEPLEALQTHRPKFGRSILFRAGIALGLLSAGAITYEVTSRDSQADHVAAVTTPTQVSSIPATLESSPTTVSTSPASTVSNGMYSGHIHDQQGYTFDIDFGFSGLEAVSNPQDQPPGLTDVVATNRVLGNFSITNSTTGGRTIAVDSNLQVNYLWPVGSRDCTKLHTFSVRNEVTVDGTTYCELNVGRFVNGTTEDSNTLPGQALLSSGEASNGQIVGNVAFFGITESQASEIIGYLSTPYAQPSILVTGRLTRNNVTDCGVVFVNSQTHTSAQPTSC